MTATTIPSPELPLSETEDLIFAPKTSAAHTDDMDIETPEKIPQQDEIRASGVRAKISDLLKEKEQEWTAVAEKKGPLRLLDLPMDVLKEIVKEVLTLPSEILSHE